MNKYIVALVALSGLGSIQSTKGMEMPAPGTVVLTNQTTQNIFVGINNSTIYPLKPGATTQPNGYKGVVTRIIVYAPNQTVSYWDWNEYGSAIRASDPTFFKKFTNFPNDMGYITVTPAGLTFTIASQYNKIGHYYNQAFPFNCTTTGDHFMTGQCGAY